MNKIYSPIWCKTISFALLLIFGTIVQKDASAQNPEDDYSLLWRIDKVGQKPSYVFGTMHVRDNRAFNFSDSVMLAIEACEHFAIELHPDSVFNKMMDESEGADVKSPKELLSEDEYARLLKKFEKENNLDLEEMGAKNPIVFKKYLSKEPDGDNKKNTFVDAYLLGIAKTLRKEIHGLERFEDQMEHFYNKSEEEQKQELLEFLELDNSLTENLFDRFVDSYEGGDLSKLKDFVLDDIYDPIMVSRNSVMANSIENLSRQGPLFSAIGAAHLIGKQSVLEKLREKGFKVSKVSSNWTGIADEYSIDPMKMEWVKFEDKEKGFSLEAPGNFIRSTELTLSMLDMYMLFDISGRSSFMFYSIDLRENEKKGKEDELKKNINKYFRKNAKRTAKKKEIKKNGLSITETTLEAPDGSNVRFQIFMANNILYCLGTFSNFENLFSPEQERFFDSFNYEMVEKIESSSEEYRQERGAFAIQFKKKPTYKVQKVPNPLDLQGTPYDIHMFSEFNAGDQSIDIVTYNDFPKGYYLDRTVDIVNELIVEMEQQGTIDQQIDTVTVDGVEGMRFRIKMQGNIPMNFMFFYRGNRLYKIISSGTDLTKAEDDEFLNSFRFMEPKKSELKEFKMDKHDFSMKMFQEPHCETDTSYTYSDYARSSNIYATTDPNNGGAYFFDHAKLNDLFKVQHLDSFYNAFGEELINWSDSIYDKEDIEIDGKKARQFYTMDIYDSTRTKYVYWIDQDYLNTGYFYVGEELFDDNRSDEIFRSYKSHSEFKQIDIYSSKAQLIIDRLNSSDTTEYKMAIGSFNYYKWDENERPILLKALEQTYPCDTSAYGARSHMISELVNYDDTDAIKELEKLYGPELNDVLKEEILDALTYFSDSSYYQVYTKLFMEDPPKRTSPNNWTLFSPFQDSLDLASVHIEQLIAIHDSGYYHSEILDIINSIAEKNDEMDDLITAHYDGFMARALIDLENYKEERSKNGYAYNSGVSTYLDLLKNVKHERFAREYTPLLNDLEGDWIHTKSLATRIHYGLPIAKSVLNKKFKDIYSRYDMIEAYFEADRTDEIPKKYCGHDALAKTFVNEYFYSQDEYPDKQEFKGKISENDSLYYVYELKFDWNNASYYGLCGPFIKDGGFPDLNVVKVYSDWEDATENWGTQAKGMIPGLYEKGYLHFDWD